MISARSRDHGRSAAKHRLYKGKCESFCPRSQNMNVMIFPNLGKVTFKPTQRDAVFQAIVPDYVLKISFIRTASEKIKSPVAFFPLRSSQRLQSPILALAAHFVPPDRSKSHLP